MGSLGFSKSKSSSSSEQRSFVDPAQQRFLEQARTGAAGLQQQQQGQIGPAAFGLAGQLGGQGQQFLQGIQGTQSALGNLGQAGFGQGQAGIDALSGIAGGTNQSLQALQAQALGQNPNLGTQIGQLGEDINTQLQRQLGGAGGLGAQAIGAGQALQGGRGQVAGGIANEAALQQFQRGATQLRSDDIGRQLQASQAALGAQQGAGGALGQLGLQQGLGQQGNELAGLLGQGQLGLGGLGQLQGQFNLGLSPFQAEFSPLQNLAGIVGGPTVLSEGSSKGKSSAFSVSGSVGA